MVDAHATSKNVVSKTRTPAITACLITDPKPMCRPSPMQPAARDGSQTAPTVSTMGAPIQKLPPEWAELIPESPPGAYDGRLKWAAVDVIPGSDAFSLTTPSWGDEAQAESSHATTKTNIPHNAERFFTKSNLAMVEPHATSGIRGLMPKETRHEKILRGKRSSRLVLHGRQLGRA